MTAGAPGMPGALFAQLREGGRMVAPVGGRAVQHLEIVEKRDGEKVLQGSFDCVFVPLIGAQGWPEQP